MLGWRPNAVWECGDGTHIDINKVCDNEYDCFDESDEKQCNMDPEGPSFLGEFLHVHVWHACKRYLISFKAFISVL